MLSKYIKECGDPHSEKIKCFNELASKVKDIKISSNYAPAYYDEENDTTTFNPDALCITWRFKIDGESYSNYVVMDHSLFAVPEVLLEETERLCLLHKIEVEENSF